jgi:hypothetical protein
LKRRPALHHVAPAQAGPRFGEPPPAARALARFGLAKQRDGSVVVHRIRDGERAGNRLFGCLPPRE